MHPIEELDGFIAGLLACPELIMPGDWLPLVWHEDSADQQPVFEHLDHANRVLMFSVSSWSTTTMSRTLMVTVPIKPPALLEVIGSKPRAFQGRGHFG